MEPRPPPSCSSQPLIGGMQLARLRRNMSGETQDSAGPAPPGRALLISLIGMAVLLAAMFYDSFASGWVLFSNDSPAAHLFSRESYLVEDLHGAWQPLFWVGNEEVSNRLTFSWFIGSTLGASGNAKFYAPFALLILGASACLFFRQLRFHPMVCALGGLAAFLNMNAFSNACWGLSAWVMARAMVFLALAALVAPGIRQAWMRYTLAGFAIGMAVMEGFDMGAIFSVFLGGGAVVIYWISTDGPAAPRVGRAVGWAGAMTICAALIAGQGVITLLETQVQGVTGAAQDEETKTRQWDFATRWSLPKSELAGVAVPGAFGYRMDTPDGGRYWGKVGRHLTLQEYIEKYPALSDADKRQVRDYLKVNARLLRHSGSGEYAGLLTLALALWALLQSFRREGPFSGRERGFIWFWAICSFFALLMALGRYGPIYWIAYELPYFSAIRNPIKFMQVFHVGVVILFAYGLQDIWKRYLSREGGPALSFGDHMKNWWRTAERYDRRWVAGSCVGVMVAGMFLLMYWSSADEMAEHLTLVGFLPDQAKAAVAFSVSAWGVALVFLVASLGLLFLILSGRFRGGPAKWAWALLAFLLVIDLARANGPWIRYENYLKKYATNEILDILKDKSHERRVVLAPFQGIPYLDSFRQDYIKQWMNELYWHHGIQSLDVPQEPRLKEEKALFKEAVGNFVSREYELTNTRLIIGVKSVITTNGPIDFVDGKGGLNDQMDPAKRRFRLHTPFSVDYNDEGYAVANRNPSGPLAIFEFTGAMPRAKLLGHWVIAPDRESALKRVVDPAFDPATSVVVVGDVPVSMEGVNLPEAQAVEIVDYGAHRVTLRAKADFPAILILNDGYHENWKAYVNGEPATVLRANYLMRGVYLNPGEYDVEFRYEPVSKSLYLSGAAFLVALGLAGLAGWTARRNAACSGQGVFESEFAETTGTPLEGTLEKKEENRCEDEDDEAGEGKSKEREDA